MSKKVRIDDLFRNRLETYDSPTPEGLWASVEANLPKEPDTKKYRTLWLLGALLLFSVTTVGMLSFWKTDTLDIESKPQTKEATTQPIAKTNPTTPNTTNAVIEHTLDKDVSTNSKETKQRIGNKINPSNTTKTKYNAKKYKAPKEPIFDVSKTKITKDFTRENLDLTPVSEGRQESSSTKGDLQSRATNSNSKNLVFDSSLEKNAPRFPVVPLFQPKIKHFPRGLGKCPNVFKSTVKPTFSVELLGGTNYALRILKSRYNNDITYVNIRKETEEFASAQSVGLRFSVAYKTGFVWRLGFIYNTINERIDLVGKSGYEHIENVEILNQRNQYQFVDIPLLIGYQTEIGKMTWGLNAGAYFNVHFKGPDNFILDENKEPIKLDDIDIIQESPIFKAQTGVSFYSSLLAAYRVADKVDVFCEPNVRVQTQSLTSQSYPLTQRYVNMGLMAGLRIKL